MRKVYVLILLVLINSSMSAQVSVSNGSPTFTIDFSSSTPITAGSNPSTAYAGAGFEPNTGTAGRLNSNAWAVTGWSNGNLAFGGTQTTAATDYTRGSTAAAVTTGGFYSFTGAPASVANPTFMIQPGGSDFAPGTLTLRIQNNGTSDLTQLALSYNIYVRNDQDRSSTFNFSYSTDNTTYTSIGALDYATTQALDALGWVIVGTAPSRNTVITGLTVPAGSYIYLRWSSADNGGTGSRDEIGLDDINCSATFAPPNTISVTGINTAPFSLADCSATAAGTIDFSATDVFTAGNTFTAQLSNDIGSFAAPVAIGSITLSGTDPSGSIPVVIPAGTVSGTGYRIRIISDLPVVTGTSSSAFQIVQLGACASSHTDYYRSVATGNWDQTTTWESSQDNTTWIAATLAPTSLANNIVIRSPHTVTVASAASADQVTIQSGATLEHSGGTFTIEDGTGDDINIQSGGILLLSTNTVSPTFANANATVNNSTGGTIRVNATGLTGNGTGINANNYVYQHQSILDYSITASFTTSGVTYFPNVNTTTIPIFRASNAGSITVGAAATTTFNGEFDCAGAGVTWQAAGFKIFRNGITGAGPMTATTSGKWQINGITAKLGGTGSLTAPTTGLEIGSGTTVTVTSNKTVTGDIALLANTYVELGNNNLTVSGVITGGSSTSYIRTNGTGVLTLPAIAAVAETFPIGVTSYNPLVINNGSGADFSARVANGINDPNGAIPTDAVQRTWYINASANTPGVDITYQYNLAECVNAAATQPNSMEVLVSDYTTWHLVPGNTTITSVGADPYTVAGTGITVPSASTPYTLGVTNTVILSTDYFISAKAQKQNNNALISWAVNTTDNVTSFDIQRAAGNGSYATIGTVTAVTGQLQYNFTDISPAAGTNLYRIRVNRGSTAPRYSNTVAVIIGNKGLLITGVVPNPAQDKADIILSMAAKGTVTFELVNMAGMPVQRWIAAAAEGTNVVPVQTGRLPAGLYHLTATSGESRSVIRLLKQ